jgi:glutaredoxin-like protein NrdH
MEFSHVPGTDRGKIVLYAISTCIWCKKTKQLLNELGVEYSFIDVDLLGQDEKDEIRKIVTKWKGTVAYPLIVINDTECIPTYSEDKIRERLG